MVLRTKTLAGSFAHVDEFDPALDRPAEDAPQAKRAAFADAYARALETGDFGPVPKRNGQAPIVWRFRHLTADEIAWLADNSGGVTRNLDTVALALEGVSGVEEEPGKPFRIERERDGRRGGFLAVKRDHLDALLRGEDRRVDAPLAGRLAGRVWSELVPRKG